MAVTTQLAKTDEEKIKEPLLDKLKRALVKAGDDEAVYNVMVEKPLETLKLMATLEPKQINRLKPKRTLKFIWWKHLKKSLCRLSMWK